MSVLCKKLLFSEIVFRDRRPIRLALFPISVLVLALTLAGRDPLLSVTLFVRTRQFDFSVVCVGPSDIPYPRLAAFSRSRNLASAFSTRVVRIGARGTTKAAQETVTVQIVHK